MAAGSRLVPPLSPIWINPPFTVVMVRPSCRSRGGHRFAIPRFRQTLPVVVRLIAASALQRGEELCDHADKGGSHLMRTRPDRKGHAQLIVAIVALLLSILTGVDGGAASPPSLAIADFTFS